MKTIKQTGVLRWKYLGNEYRDGAILDMQEHETNSGTHYMILQEQVIIADEVSQRIDSEWRDLPVSR